MRGSWRGGAGSTAIVALLWLLVGCSAQEVDEVYKGPYHIAEVQIFGVQSGESGEEAVMNWGPDSEAIGHWFDVATKYSDRGISRKEPGMGMRAVVNHSTQLISREEGATLLIDIEVQLERMEVDAEKPMITLTAQVNYRHPFVLGRPTPEVLEPMSRTLTRQAVDDVVAQLREQAVVRQTLGPELAKAIKEADRVKSARLYAIERVVELREKSAEEALGIAARDPDDDVAMAAAVALFELRSEKAVYAVMHVAQRMSRDRHYERYLELMPMLATFEEPWVELYLETVAEAHRIRRVRQRARALTTEESATLEADSVAPNIP